MQIHQVFVVNLEDRKDRKQHIVTQFSGRPEFRVTVIPAVTNAVGSWGLWQTLCTIVKMAQQLDNEYVILCEDDHLFTEGYDREVFCDQINTLNQQQADLLLGGASWFETVLQVRRNLFWVQKFNGLQFTVIYKRFYENILALPMKLGDNVDIVMSIHTNKSFLCYPYISTQQEFGYSDITVRNAQQGYVTEIFNARMEKLRQLDKVGQHYNTIS